MPTDDLEYTFNHIGLNNFQRNQLRAWVEVALLEARDDAWGEGWCAGFNDANLDTTSPNPYGTGGTHDG